jgi:glycosyltransferase involved in cell wall biosynthesis
VSNTGRVPRFDHIPASSTAPQEFSDAFTVEDIEIRVVRDPLEELRVIPDPILSFVRVSVVIPTLNEAENLPHVFDRMPPEIDEVILVDSHSIDGTVEVAKRLWPSVVVIQQNGQGKGNALACGFWAATGDVIAMLDADGSSDPAELPRFVAALLAGADFAKGSRFIAGGGSEDITNIRRFGNWGLAKLVNWIWGGQYSDLCYGYNAFWRRCLPFITPDCDGFEVETLINIRAARANLRIFEVPSFEYDRRHGTSNLNARRDGFRVLRTILAERVRPSLSGRQAARSTSTVI